MTAETLTIALALVGGAAEPQNLTVDSLAALGLEGFPSRAQVRERAVEIVLHAFQEQQKQIERLEAKARNENIHPIATGKKV